MKRAYLVLLGLISALALPTAALGATPNVGQHIHVEISNHPVDEVPIAKAPYTFHVTIRRHDMPGSIRYIRLDDSSTTRARITFSPPLPACTDCATTFDWTIDFSGWSTGRHEFRWHADSQDSDPGFSGTQRQYTTSRAQVCIGSCSPNVGGRKADWLGGGSWYTGPEYVVPLLTSDLTTIRPGGTFTMRSQYQSHVCAYLNPNFHAGSHGTALGCGASATIPSTADVGDKLVIVADVAQEAGVLELRVGSGSRPSTMFLGTQSWWARTGLVIP